MIKMSIIRNGELSNQCTDEYEAAQAWLNHHVGLGTFGSPRYETKMVEVTPAQYDENGEEISPAVYEEQTIENPNGYEIVIEDITAKIVERQIMQVLENAISFGDALMKEFTKDNIMMGITQAGMTGTVRKAMQEVILALTTGSLYDAITEAKAIPADKKDGVFITDARLLVFVNKIEEYLKIPLSTEL